MKGKIFTIICLLIFTSFLTLNAQWARTYGTDEDENAFCIQRTNDGGYIVAGNTGVEEIDERGLVTPGQDIWITKLSSDGKIEWQKIYGDDATDEVHFIQQTSDGGFIFGGRIEPHQTLGRTSIIKLFPNGDIEWQKYYGDASTINVVHSLQQTGDGGYIVAGQHYFSGWQSYHILILKLYSDGSVDWSKSYRGNIDDKPSIQLTSDGGYIVAGYTASSGAGESDIWILKLTLDGTIEWQRTYGGSEGENAYSIQQTNDGGYIVAGLILSFGAGQPDFWVLKLSSEGDIEWNKTYGGSESEIAYSIQQTFDGGYVVVGETESFGAGYKDIWILKLSIWGDIEWQKTYGGRQNETASFIQQTGDGGYVVAGSTDTYGEGKRDFLILKLFPNGDINSSCIFISDSNAEVSNPDISPVDTYVNPEYPDILYENLNISPRESEAVVHSLCLGPRTLSLSASIGGTTNPQPGTYIYDNAERIAMSPYTDDGYNFIGWSGDVLSTDKLIYVTMDADKSIKANFSENVLDDLWQGAKKAPCFIATAAFGSPLHPYVKTLQDFRDRYLMSSRAGRKLVTLYYKYSPHIAELITSHKALRTVVRIWLIPFVAMGYSMVHFGPVKTTVMLVLTSMLPFFFVWFYRRRGKRDEP